MFSDEEVSYQATASIVLLWLAIKAEKGTNQFTFNIIDATLNAQISVSKLEQLREFGSCEG